MLSPCNFRNIALAVGSCLTLAASASAQVVYATGQFFNPADPTSRRNIVYAINPSTGVATPLSEGTVASVPAALAVSPGGLVLAYNAGSVFSIEPSDNSLTSIVPVGVDSTGFDVTEDGTGWLITRGSSSQLYRVNLRNGDSEAVGSEFQIAESIEAGLGLSVGAAVPFIIGLGSVGGDIYGVSAQSGITNLVRIDPEVPTVTVLGTQDAVRQANGGLYSGFSALTGVDTDNDGLYDQLLGGVNFFDNDNNPATPTVRFGGIARYDLNTGSWTLLGSNPGIIWFGMGSGPCLGDFTRDGFVDDSDFVTFAAAYEAFTCPSSGACPADINGDGFVDDSDFVFFAAAYEAFTCP